MNQGFNKSKEYITDCAIIIRRGRGGAEKLELSKKNLDSTPLQNKKISVNPPLLNRTQKSSFALVKFPDMDVLS